MSILQILKYPNPNLRQQAKAVKKFDQNLKLTIDDMLETMKDAKGIGLAATQVDIHSRIIVIDLSEDYSDPQIFINPEMLTLFLSTLILSIQADLHETDIKILWMTNITMNITGGGNENDVIPIRMHIWRPGK